MQKWITNLVMTYVVKNWKTTLTGVLGFVVTQFPGVPAYLAAHGYSMNDLQALLLLVIGVLAHDGTTVPAVTVAKLGNDAG